jgi:hypothetical protein
VRQLTDNDFISPPPVGVAACAYETNTRYGQLLVAVQSMGRSEYDAQYVERDPINTRKVPNLGEDARFSGCGDLNVYTEGRVLGLSIQYADCKVAPRLASLARVGLRRL